MFVYPRNKLFREKNLERWEQMIRSLFDGTIPTECVWKKNEDIVNVLNLLCRKENSNHTFFPNGGGLDLTSVQFSAEEGCIELHFGLSIEIAKPESLAFNSFGERFEWAYFRLETAFLAPSGTYESDKLLEWGYEELVEIEPGIYKEREVWDQGLPSTARVVTRSFGGAYVLFAKASTYNAISDTYDARHNKMNGNQFREYIAKEVERQELKHRQEERES